jgi:heptosyltransferase-2
MESIKTPAPVQLSGRARILITRTGDMGDALLATPMLRALRTRYPAARIDMLVNANARALLGECPHVDTIFTLPTLSAANTTQLAWLMATLRDTRYEAAIFANHLTLPSGRRGRRLLATALGAPLTVGLDNGHGGFLRLRVPDDGFGVRHEVEYALALAAALDATLPEGDHAPRLSDLGWRDLQPSVWQPEVPLRVVLHPGSGTYSVARRWPASRWAQLTRALRLEFTADVTLVGGPEERGLTASIVEALGGPTWVTSYVGATTPRQLADILANAHLFIGNDSLPMHLATAAGVPVIAVFGPSNARAWGPYAPGEPDRVAVIRRTDLPCSPCIYRGHDLGTPQGCPPRSCLIELEIGPAMLAARRLLRRARPAPHA